MAYELRRLFGLKYITREGIVSTLQSLLEQCVCTHICSNCRVSWVQGIYYVYIDGKLSYFTDSVQDILEFVIDLYNDNFLIRLAKISDNGKDSWSYVCYNKRFCTLVEYSVYYEIVCGIRTEMQKISNIKTPDELKGFLTAGARNGCISSAQKQRLLNLVLQEEIECRTS